MFLVINASTIKVAIMRNKLQTFRRQLVQNYRNYLINLSKKRSRAGLYEFLEAEFSRISRGAKVLTIGSGGEINVLLDRYAALRLLSVVSFDIDQSRSPDILGDICTDSLGSERFDVIVISEVLEHVNSPNLALENIHEALKCQGRLIVSVPFCLPIHDRPNDYFRFTKYGLELVLSKFSDVSIKERNSYFEAIDVIWMRLMLEDSEKAFQLSQIILPIVYYAKRPITVLLNKFVKTDGITTGYVATAVKK